jgi:hypothetical protein
MNNEWHEYEQAKQKLQEQGLPPHEYTEQVKALAERLGL